MDVTTDPQPQLAHPYPFSRNLRDRSAGRASLLILLGCATIGAGMGAFRKIYDETEQAVADAFTEAQQMSRFAGRFERQDAGQPASAGP